MERGRVWAPLAFPGEARQKQQGHAFLPLRVIQTGDDAPVDGLYVEEELHLEHTVGSHFHQAREIKLLLDAPLHRVVLFSRWPPILCVG